MRLEDLTGQRFNRLVVLNRAISNTRQTKWLCRCDCGGEAVVAAAHLKSGNTKSCGCAQREAMAATGRRNRTHGHTTLGHRSRTWVTWRAMINRCHVPSVKDYVKYGARGISVTKPWRDSFESFLNDMGERPEGTSIDRIDNRFGYFMANCRWATLIQQRANQRRIYVRK